MARSGGRSKVCKAHVGPVPTAVPLLLEGIPLLSQLEREVEEELRGVMQQRLQDKIAQVEESQFGTAPRCECSGKAMKNRGRRYTSFLSRFGTIRLKPRVYRCRNCGRQCRPLMEALGDIVGQVSGSLARLLALLAVVVPYQMAAQLAGLFFGVEVSAMTVWRIVQELGQAWEEYAEALAAYHASPHHESSREVSEAPDAVLLGVDGCSLGMQVRETRRRRKSDEPLPALEPVEEGHFREVKTGVLLLPSERVETSPGRRSVVRRALVTCLGHADQIFDRLWSKLQELGWLGAHTVVVIIGDGAEWIWNRATMFVNRCEILDFWHAIEYAWKFARLRYGQGSKRAANWVSRIADDLRAGKVHEVIARLHRIKTSCPEEEEALDDVIRYYTDNAARMKYDEYLRLGYGIGSGAVESAHKQVVHARMRQAGMRWSELGAQHLLALRVLLLNNQWSLLDRLPMKRLAQ